MVARRHNMRQIGKTWYLDKYIDVPEYTDTKTGERKTTERFRKKLSTNVKVAEKMRDKLLADKELASVGIISQESSLSKIKDDFLREVQPRVTLQTYHDYKTILDNTFIEMGKTGTIDIANVRSKFNDHINKRKEDGISVRTLNLTIHLLKRVLSYNKALPFNPIADLKAIRKKKKIFRILNLGEVHALLECSGVYTIVWLMFLESGLRRAEGSDLKVRDLDFIKCEITVRDSKTNKGIGNKPIPDELANELREHVKGKSPTDYVVSTSKGTRIYNNLLKRLQTCVKRAGIERPEEVTIHTFKRTYASHLAERGTHPKYIQELLGHEDAAMSQNIYVQANKQLVKDAVRNIKLLPRKKIEVSQNMVKTAS